MVDKILEEDLAVICSQEQAVLNALNGKTVLITGITGLIGSQLAKALLYFNRSHHANIHVAGIARTRKRAAQVFQDSAGTEALEIYFQDVREMRESELKADIVVHCANTTSSREYVDRPVETIQTIVDGTCAVLDFVRKQKSCGMVYLSSMEIYGRTPPAPERVTENDGGYINPLSVRSSYSEGKRMAECLCAAYAKEYGTDVKIARLAQVFGADVPFEDNRVFAQLARCVLRQEDFVMRTAGKSYGNYCYTRDAVRAILTLLSKGRSGEAYNVVNEAACMTIRQMSEMVAEEIGRGCFRVTFDIPASQLACGYAPDTALRLSGEKMRQLGWAAEVPLQEMYRRMIASMKYRLAGTCI